MEEYIDEIFKALYGDDRDEYGELYSRYYEDEGWNMCETIKSNIELLLNYFTLDSTDVSKIIVLAEHDHIGNNLCLDYTKLDQLSQMILDDETA